MKYHFSKSELYLISSFLYNYNNIIIITLFKFCTLITKFSTCKILGFNYALFVIVSPFLITIPRVLSNFKFFLKRKIFIHKNAMNLPIFQIKMKGTKKEVITPIKLQKSEEIYALNILESEAWCRYF